MLYLFALLPLVFGDGSFAKPPDFFFRHLAHHLNHSVNPCENFYRHVCPSTIDSANTLSVKTYEYLEKITQNPRVLENLSEMSTRTEESLAFLGNYAITLMENEKCDCQSSDSTVVSEICKIVCFTPNINIRAVIQSTNTLFTTHIAIENDYETLIETEKSIEAIFNELSEIMITELELTYPANEYHGELLNYLKNKRAIFTSSIENLKQAGTAVSKNLVDWYWNINKLHGHFVLNQTLSDSDLDSEVRQFARFYNLLNAYHYFVDFSYNAFNNPFTTPPNVMMTFGACMMHLEARNKALQFGFLTMLLGHEVAHTYTHLNETFAKSGHYHVRAECVAGNYRESCKLFAEEGLECESGFPFTHQEDASDVVGARLAYKAFLNAFEGKMDDVTLQVEEGDRTFTNRQLFFYGPAIASCVDKAQSGHDPLDNHSGPLFRLNAYMREMAAFSEAFNCQPGDAMYQEPSEQCLLFGDAPLFV